MNNQLVRTFSPINVQGGLDTRFDEDMIFIYRSIGSGVEEGLLSFNHKTSELEKTYGGYALNLCEAFIKHIKYVEENELDGSIGTKLMKDKAAFIRILKDPLAKKAKLECYPNRHVSLLKQYRICSKNNIKDHTLVHR